jgi:hypothetical protein
MKLKLAIASVILFATTQPQIARCAQIITDNLTMDYQHNASFTGVLTIDTANQLNDTISGKITYGDGSTDQVSWLFNASSYPGSYPNKDNLMPGSTWVDLAMVGAAPTYTNWISLGINNILTPKPSLVTTGSNNVLFKNSGNTFYDRMVSGNITTTATPIPATFWLFGSALSCLIGINRYKVMLKAV